MVAFDGSEPCGQAELYYHDFLEDPDHPAIPQAVKDHLQDCTHCRERLARLAELLGRLPDAAPAAGDRALLGELQGHFELLDEELTCRHVKRFLPGLLLSAARIRIPTPVTAHIDHCPSCTKDLEALDALHLDDDQLARLARLYADGSANGLWTCLRTQSRISVGRAGSLERFDATMLDHLCVCPRCRNRLYQRRQRLLDKGRSGGAEPGAVGCEEISATDLFDLVVPYTGRLGSDEDGWGQQCRAHLESCPDCLEKAQQLHRTVYGVLERADSDVITVCTTVSDGPSPAEETDSLYAGYPIDVQVRNRVSEPAVGAAWPRRAVARFRPILKPALMAAAMIPLVVIFHLTMSKALGLTARQIQKAVDGTPRIHVRVFGAGKEEPKQELWVARQRRLLGVKMQGTLRVFDLEREELHFAGPEGVRTQVGLARNEFVGAEQTMKRLLRLPQNSLLWDGDLQELPDSSAGDVRFEIYQMDWQDRTSGGRSLSCRWKVYIDPAFGRPVKIEFFRGDSFGHGLMLEETREFEYPEESEIIDQFADVGIVVPQP